MASHTYWRMRATTVQAGPGSSFSAPEIRMFDVPSGGATKCVGGTAIASSEFGFAPASRAFDGTTAAWGSSGAVPQWIGYQFPAPVEIARLEYFCDQTITAPTNFTIDYSDDGVNWTTVYTGTASGWTSGETRSYSTGLPGSGVASEEMAVVFCCT